MRDTTEIAQRIDTFAHDPNGALIVLPGPVVIGHREAIIVAAARYRLPTIYPYSFFTADGGLLSYGSDLTDLYRRGASQTYRSQFKASVRWVNVIQDPGNPRGSTRM